MNATPLGTSFFYHPLGQVVKGRNVKAVLVTLNNKMQATSSYVYPPMWQFNNLFGDRFIKSD
jgi:hypothetical protein